MGTTSPPSEEKESVAADRELQIARLKEKRSELVGGITDLGKSSSDTADSLENSVDEAVTKYGKDQEAFTAYAAKLESSALKSLSNISKRARREVESAASYFRIYLAVVATTLTAVGFFGGYLFVVYFPSSEAYFFGPWVLITLVVMGDLLYVHRKLSKVPASLEEDLGNQSNSVLLAVSDRPSATHDLTLLKRFARAASNGIKGVTVRTADLLLTDNRIIKHETKAVKQERFVEDFIFAIRRYNLDISNETKVIMITKTWLMDDVPRWLEDVSKDMGSTLNLDSRLFQLMYYEFFDSKYADKLWAEIRSDQTKRYQICQLLLQRKLVVVPEHASTVQIIDELLRGMPSYSLEEMRNRVSEFFSNLFKFKEACCSYLDSYGIQVIEKKELLLSHVPETADPSEWRDEIITYIAEQIVSKPVLIIKLLILSSEGDEGSQRLWSQVREGKDLKELALILATKRVRPKFTNFSRETFLKHLSVAMSSSIDDFSLTEIQSSLDQLENEILTTKYRLQHTISEFRLGRFDANQVNSYVPLEVAGIESGMLADAAKAVGMNYELLRLLHSTANGLPEAQDLFQRLVATPLTEDLARLLIEKSFVAKSKFNDNIVTLLQAQTSFTTTGFVSTYSRYDALQEGLDNLIPFLDANRVLGRRSLLAFQEILDACPVNESTVLEVQLERLTGRLVKDAFEGTVLNGDQHSDLALAAAAIFMRTHGYSGFAQLCQRASRRQFAPKVMFQYISLVTEESLSGNLGGLEEAVSRALRGVEDLSNYNYFKTELQDGKLAPSAALLFSQFRKDIRSEFRNLETRGFDTGTLSNYLDPIKDLLYNLMNEKVVREFLLTQVLSAYLLTVPGAVPGITFLETGEGKYIQMAQNILAASPEDPVFRDTISKGDHEFKDVVRLATGGGKATRIGLVPLEMGFEDFSVRFNEVWTLAVDLYNANEERKVETPLPCYLIRIFPSDDGLKEIMRSPRIETRPLEVIRRLIRDSTTERDAVSLLSLMQRASNSRLALAGAIKAIFDAPKGSLLLLAGDRIRDSLSRSGEVLNRFTKKEVDKLLLRAYHSKRLTELGTAIVDRIQANGAAVARDEFREHMSSVIGNPPEIPAHELAMIVDTVFDRVWSIGKASIL